MGNFIYWVPDEALVTKDNYERVLRGIGLWDTVYTGLSPMSAQTHTGPLGNTGGCIFACVKANQKEDLNLKFDPDTQTWTKAKGFCLGFETADKPGPSDLERDIVVPGYDVPLEDGNAWRIPLVRVIDGTTCLPQKFGRDENGAIIRITMDRYADLCEKAASMSAVLLGATAENLDELRLNAEEQFAIAEEAIAINYHVGPFEISALGLLTTANVGYVAGCVADFPAIASMQMAAIEAAKKKGE